MVGEGGGGGCGVVNIEVKARVYDLVMAVWVKRCMNIKINWYLVDQ